MQEPKTSLEASQYFSDAENCRKFMVSVRWFDEVVPCPYCGNDKVPYLDKAKLYFCFKHKESGKPQKFSLKVGTIFEESPIGWINGFAASDGEAVDLCRIDREGGSSRIGDGRVEGRKSY